MEAPNVGKAESLGAQLNRMSGVQEKSLYGEGGKKTVDKEQFLKMFMEQLKYQDPMSPVKNEQFSQQMAMFSQLEQQVNTNKNLEKMIAQQNNTQIAALQLVGKDILADRAAIFHEKEKMSTMQFKIPADAAEVKVEIKDFAGEVVKKMNLGGQSQGEVKTRWDGNDESGRPLENGRYSYTVSMRGMDGKEQKVETKVDGRVTGVTTAGGTVFLLVGDQRIALNEVETIKEASAANAVAIAQTKDAEGKPILLNDGAAKGAGANGTAGIENASKKSEPDADGGIPSAANPAPMKVAVSDEAKKDLDSGSPVVQEREEAELLHPLLPMMYR